MTESNTHLRFWMSGEIQSDVGYAHQEAWKPIEGHINECVGERDYGEGLKLWAYIAVILNEETDSYYPEIKRYRKREKEVEFRLKINHKEFLEGDSNTHIRLLAQSVLRSLELMKGMHIKDFDLDSLITDVNQCLSKYL
jgi:hypothetical protein